MKITIVPMGTYTIRNKKSASPEELVISPGAQTCVVVVLKSPSGIAVAHIDTPFAAAQVIPSMIEELEIMGPGRINARLYGGDYGNPLFNSAKISNPIYAELNRKNIFYRHTDYQLTAGFVMATAAALWAYSPFSPESRIIVLATLIMAYKATNLLKIALPKKWHPGFLGYNIDVSVNIKTAKVQLEKDNEENSKGLLCQARDKLDNSIWKRLTARASLNPDDPRNEASLAMIRV